MKPKIHPDYHDVVAVFPDGSKMNMRSTYGKPGSELHIDVDWKKHPAWTGGGVMQMDARKGRVAKFNQRFAMFNLGGGAAAEDKKDDKAE